MASKQRNTRAPVGQDLWWRFLSWRGFQILGRLSLPVLLFHWSYNLSLVGGRLLPLQVSVLELLSYPGFSAPGTLELQPGPGWHAAAVPGGDWLATIFLTYVSAVPAHLFVELPVQHFLRAIAG